MRKEREIVDRIKGLIEAATEIAVEKRSFAMTYSQLDFAAGWMISASNCIELIVPPLSPYRSAISMARARFDTAGLLPTNESSTKSATVGAVRGILQSLLQDIEAGLITRLEARIVGEAFDDFLDQAEILAAKGQIASGVLAGVVFEDTIRRIGRENQIEHDKVDQVIIMLVKAEVITEAKAKAARAAAHVRTKATHAEWNAFDISDVKATILTTRDLIATHLS